MLGASTRHFFRQRTAAYSRRSATLTAREAQYYVAAGMPPLQALRAATIEPARMFGADDKIGSLKEDKFAHILALEKDPTTDIQALDNILFVMKGANESLLDFTNAST